jgi:hypothetical protein
MYIHMYVYMNMYIYVSPPLPEHDPPSYDLGEPTSDEEPHLELGD